MTSHTMKGQYKGKVSALILFSFISLLCAGQRKNVCFSFDDLPLVSYSITDSTMQKGLVGNLISSLLKNRIPAIGFVNENKLFNNNGLNIFKVDLLNMWVDNGLDLGNHTFRILIITLFHLMNLPSIF